MAYFEINLVSQANPNTFQNNPTIAAGDFKIRLNGSGAAANLVNDTPTVTGNIVRIDLDASEWDGNKGIITWQDAAGDEWLPGYLTFDNTADGIAAFVDNLLDMDDAVETGLTVRQLFRALASGVAGKLSGAGGTNILIRDVNDTKTRINAIVDANGNRSAVSLDLD